MWGDIHSKEPLPLGTLLGALDTDLGSHLGSAACMWGEPWAREPQFAQLQSSIRTQLQDGVLDSPKWSPTQGAERRARRSSS